MDTKDVELPSTAVGHDPLTEPPEARRPAMAVDHRMAEDARVSAVFERKVTLINAEIERIGWGKFNWWLLAQAAYGWAADNIVFECAALSLTQVQMEWNVEHVEFATVSLYIGNLIGTFFWGFSSDIIGRRLSWNTTLLITFIFGMATAGAPNFVGFSALLACIGLGVGGNLPVDGTLLLELLPGKHQWLVNFLSVFWVVGQTFATLMGWALIPQFTCEQTEGCTKSQNMGWRYMWLVCSGVCLAFWLVRFFVYPICESPRFLLSQGDDVGALNVLRFIAEENKTKCELTLSDLRAAGEAAVALETPSTEDEKDEKKGLDDGVTTTVAGLSAELAAAEDTFVQLTGAELRKAVVGNWRDTLKLFSPDRIRRSAKIAGGAWSGEHVKALFATPRMAWNTFNICLIWTLIAFSYCLYNALIGLYLKEAGANQGTYTINQQYAQMVEIAVCGIPGSFFSAAMAEIPWLGRKLTMAFWTMLSGVLLFGFTTARTPSAILGWSTSQSLAQDAMYAVLYAMSYELFPTPHRGTGEGLAMGFQRVGDVFAPLVAVYTSDYKTPIVVSGALSLVASALMLLLPYETRGRTAL